MMAVTLTVIVVDLALHVVSPTRTEEQWPYAMVVEVRRTERAVASLSRTRDRNFVGRSEISPSKSLVPSPIKFEGHVALVVGVTVAVQERLTPVFGPGIDLGLLVIGEESASLASRRTTVTSTMALASPSSDVTVML